METSFVFCVRALVQAMESCVERVWLDIEALTENSGHAREMPI